MRRSGNGDVAEAVERLDYYLRHGGYVSHDDVDAVLVERDALREALGKLAELPTVVTDEYAYKVTEIAHRALGRHP